VEQARLPRAVRPEDERDRPEWDPLRDAESLEVGKTEGGEGHRASSTTFAITGRKTSGKSAAPAAENRSSARSIFSVSVWGNPHTVSKSGFIQKSTSPGHFFMMSAFHRPCFV